MADNYSDIPFKNQNFMLTVPDDEQDPEGEGVYAGDLDIIANTYRSIVDQNAFEEMIASWNRRLADIENKEFKAPISGTLQSQILEARRTMETLDIPAENDSLNRAIRDVPGPAVVIAPNGRVVMTNETGTRAFGRSQGMWFDSEVIDSRSSEDFEALRRSANTQGNRSEAILRIVPGDKAIAPFVAEGYIEEVAGQKKSYIILRSIEIEWTEKATNRLLTAFGLSQAEAEVARLFFVHRSLQKICDERGVSMHTVRYQMKTILSKVEAPTQADLIRLLAMIASRAAMNRQGQASAWQDPLGREERVTLPDGRVVAWTWMGAPDGVPALVLRGFAMGFLLPPEAERRLQQAGIKLYALSRPGYGNSSLHADLSAIDDNLIALKTLLAHRMEGKPCVAIGLSNAIVPLLALQQSNPQSFGALIALGYTGIMDRTGAARLPLIQRTMYRMAAQAPWILEVMAKSGHRMMQQYGVDWYLERAYKGRSRDMATYADPDIVPLMREACAHLLMQGHMAFVRDLQIAHEPVDDAFDTLTIPFLWLASTEDGVYNEESFFALEKRNDHITVEPVPESGELIYYQKTDLIIDRLIEAVNGVRYGRGGEMG
ncbi:alpha/beta hydrolase [uncultured Cohaesibacter sp.]|uniref:alpha/beta hydrolase n=1 Tax=uncultured Cohaesibacter sp. TaxID=1002546 RepID=UPI0029C94CDF|nr:alpha/beta hydrolase [uncultured Cohaesibacter sp.]